MFAVATLAIAALALFWALQPRDLRWVALRGISLLRSADSAAESEALIDRWFEETLRLWRDNPMDLVDELLTERFISDEHARRLLAAVSGADYGDRIDDWRRWRRERSLRSTSTAPQAQRSEAVGLRPLWEAPIGLTQSGSTILPSDGAIYVASLGAAFESQDDPYDGVVRVDGATGEAELIFTPPGRTPRDVVGVALARERLFVACRNGALHGVRLDGRLEWTTNCGAPLAAAPLALEGARGLEIAAITDAGQLHLINGANGRVAWTARFRVPAGFGSRPGDPGSAFSLTLMRTASAPAVVVAHSRGALEAFAIRDGRSLWRTTMDAGVAAHPVAVTITGPADVGESGRPVAGARPSSSGDVHGFVAGADGWLRSLPPISDEAPWLARGVASPPGDLPIRTLRGNQGAPPRLLMTTRGENDWRGGVVSLTDARGEQLWRVPLPAALDSAPVVADVTQDGLLEVLIADRSGLLRCYSVGRFGAVHWGSLRGDSYNTGTADNAFSFGQSPPGHQSAWRPRP